MISDAGAIQELAAATSAPPALVPALALETLDAPATTAASFRMIVAAATAPAAVAIEFRNSNYAALIIIGE